jgi:hypothetical protein
MVQGRVTGPEISDTYRVNVSQLALIGESVYEKTITFSYLVEADSGSYNCSAFMISPDAYVIASNSTSTTEAISVECKQVASN